MARSPVLRGSGTALGHTVGMNSAVNGTGEPRWLTSKQSDAWIELAAVLVVLPAALDSQLQRDAGLSHFEYQVLALLSTAPDRTANMTELASRTNGSASRLSHVVGRLERRGWVTRAPDPGNGRFMRATLTEAGMDKLVEAAPGHVETVQWYVFDQLTPTDVQDLARIARKIKNRQVLITSAPPSQTGPSEC